MASCSVPDCDNQFDPKTDDPENEICDLCMDDIERENPDPRGRDVGHYPESVAGQLKGGSV